MFNKLNNPASRSNKPIYRDINFLIVVGITLMELMGTMSINPALPVFNLCSCAALEYMYHESFFP